MPDRKSAGGSSSSPSSQLLLKHRGRQTPGHQILRAASTEAVFFGSLLSLAYPKWSILTRLPEYLGPICSITDSTLVSGVGD